MKRPVLLIAVLLLFCVSSVHAAKYVNPSATGSATGADWTNAYTSIPSPLTRGETYYIADGSYSGYLFDDAVSGTQLITIKKCATGDGTCENAAGYVSGDHDGVATFTGEVELRTSYITINGSVGGGPNSWDSGHGIKMTSAIKGTETDVTNFSLMYTEIDRGIEDNGAETYCLYFTNASGYTYEDFYFAYNWMHSVGGGDIMRYRDMTGLTVEYNYFSNAYVGGTGHPDLFQAYGGAIADTIFRYNKVEDLDGTYYLGTHSAGAATNTNLDVYGNIFDITTGSVSNSIIAGLSSGGTVTNLKFYNNTIFGSVWPSFSSNGFQDLRGSGNVAYNNLWIRVSGSLGSVGWSNATHDDNTGGGNVDIGEEVYSGNPLSDPGNGDYSLTAGAATSMAAGRTLSGYMTDMFGNTRGDDGKIDRGAIEYGVGSLTTKSKGVGGHVSFGGTIP